MADDETPLAPVLAEGIRSYWVAPAAPWLAEVGGVSAGTALVPHAIARVQLTYDDDKAGLRHTEEWEALTPLSDPFDPTRSVHVDYDDRDLRTDRPSSAVYRLPSAPVKTAAWWKAAQKSLTDHLVANVHLTVQRNSVLNMWSRADETPEAFANRCVTAAEMKADEGEAKLRDQWETKMDRAKAVLAEAERRADQAKADAGSNRKHEILAGAGDLLSVFLGGRRSRSIGRAIRGASARHSAAEKTSQRVDNAHDLEAQRQDELTKLETELSDALFAIDARWHDNAKAIDTVEIPLERADVVIAEFALVWIPT